MAGILAAGAIGAALAVGGVAYAGGNGEGAGEQIVRVVETEDGTGAGYDCPDKGGQSGEGNTESGTESAGDNL